jgi:hypothetical protein
LVGDAPLIAFYDPFGLSAPMAQLKDLMNRPNRDRIGHYATTELIINVSYTGIARNCGAATSDMSNPSEKWGEVAADVRKAVQ